jgi:hypothetical protein
MGLALVAACLLAASPRPQSSLTLERPASCLPGEVSPACPLQANNDVLAEDNDKVDTYASDADIPAPTASVAQPFYTAPAAASGPAAAGTAYSEECAHYSATESSTVDNAWCELNCPAKNCPEAMCQCKKAEEVRKIKQIKEVKRSESSATTDATPPAATDATPPAASGAMPTGAPCKPGEVSPACPMHANNDVMADDPNCKPGVVTPECPMRANNDVVADDGEYADDEQAAYQPRDDDLANDWRTAAKRQHQKDQAQRAKDKAALKRQKEKAKEARELARHPELAPPIKQLSQAAVASAEAAEAAKAAAAHVAAKQSKRAAEAGRHSSKYNNKECDMECRQAERRTLKEAERAGAIAEKEKQRSFDDDAKRDADATNSAAKAEKDNARAQAREAKEMAAAAREDMKTHHREGTKHFPHREGFGGQPAPPVWPLQ